MQITIEIPDELSNTILKKGKSFNVAIIEALELYILHDTPIKTIPNLIEEEIDWSAKWEQWFAELETTSISIVTQPPQHEYTALLIDKYRNQGLESTLVPTQGR
jgi:hypothetical protein